MKKQTSLSVFYRFCHKQWSNIQIDYLSDLICSVHDYKDKNPTTDKNQKKESLKTRFFKTV